MSSYDKKHFVSALSHARHESREAVRQEAMKDFEAFLADATKIPRYVTDYDFHLSRRAMSRGSDRRMHHPKWKVSRPQPHAAHP